VRRMVWPVLVTLAVIGVLLLLVLPGKTLLAQQHQISQTEQRIAIISQENAKLAARTAQLRQPADIEQLAHQEFGLVMPGQKAYDIIPPGPLSESSATTVPTTSPTTTAVP
jgi:cell division protein FtsB